MSIKIFSFWILILFYGCKPVCDCYSEKSSQNINNLISPPWKKINEISTVEISNLISREKFNEALGFHLYKKGDRFFFISLSSKDTLEIVDFDNRKIVAKKYFKGITKFKEFYNGLFLNDTFHFVDSWGKKYYQYKIKDDWEFEIIDSLDIGKFKDFAKCEITLKLRGNGILYSSPNVLFQYADRRDESFIGEKSYLKVNMKNKSIEKVIDYPDCYNCSFIYDSDASSVFLQNGSILTLFNQYDKLFLQSSESGKQKSFSLKHNCKYWTFDKKKEQDLSYVRKYGLTGERNLNLLNIGDKYFVALKFNAKKSLSEKNVFSLFVFDSLYNQIYSEVISHPIYYPAFFNYKDGFIIFNDSLNKAFYYDFKN